MKIKNIGKFRDELFAAIKDSSYWNAHESFLVAKSKEIADAYYKLMNEDGDWHFLPYYEYNKDGKGMEVVALPHTLQFSGTDVFLVIDDSADARFYKNTQTHYELIGTLTSDYYKNRMSFAMALIRRVDEIVKENRR